MPGSIPRISAKSTENGLSGYFDTSNIPHARHFENFISVNFFGSDGGIFYHPYKASVEMKVHTLKIPGVELNRKTGIFIAASLSGSLNGFSYGNQLSSSKLMRCDFKLKLPVKDNAIDFKFMESFVVELEAERIAELEAERIAELEAYLKAAGLKDYHLNDIEKQALQDFEENNLGWVNFTFKSIFNNIEQGRRLKKDDQVSGVVPFVMSGTTNSGVSNFISNPVSMFPRNSITIDIFGNSFYRNYNYSAGDDTGAYWSDEIEYSRQAMLFFTSAMQKSIVGKFSYGNKLRSSRSFDFKMQLPCCLNKPDYRSIEHLISAIQKLVIREVVSYSEARINAHRAVTGQTL